MPVNNNASEKLKKRYVARKTTLAFHWRCGILYLKQFFNGVMEVMSDSDIFLFSANIEEDICISVSRPTPDSSVADAGKFTSVMSEFAKASKQDVNFVVFNLFPKSFFMQDSARLSSAVILKNYIVAQPTQAH